jgi:hypothetical protein
MWEEIGWECGTRYASQAAPRFPLKAMLARRWRTVSRQRRPEAVPFAHVALGRCP